MTLHRNRFTWDALARPVEGLLKGLVCKCIKKQQDHWSGTQMSVAWAIQEYNFLCGNVRRFS